MKSGISERVRTSLRRRADSCVDMHQKYTGANVVKTGRSPTSGPALSGTSSLIAVSSRQPV